MDQTNFLSGELQVSILNVLFYSPVYKFFPILWKDSLPPLGSPNPLFILVLWHL